MRHPGLLDRDRAVLLLIDLQEGYRNVLFGWEQVVSSCALLVRGATVLGLPLLVTEQYPRGLGHTAREVAEWLPPGTEIIEKLTMSCCRETQFMTRLVATRCSQVLVAGIETHACVNQTVHDLLAAGLQVHVARDTTSSRYQAHTVPAWQKMCAAGMLPTSSEQALLELVGSARAPEFKALQALLKEAPLPLMPA
jgi:nicotinamidase-related amidase